MIVDETSDDENKETPKSAKRQRSGAESSATKPQRSVQDSSSASALESSLAATSTATAATTGVEASRTDATQAESTRDIVSTTTTASDKQLDEDAPINRTGRAGKNSSRSDAKVASRLSKSKSKGGSTAKQPEKKGRGTTNKRGELTLDSHAFPCCRLF